MVAGMTAGGSLTIERAATRERIVAAAAGLLAQRGRDAVSTRAVSAAAGVQAPTIYRLVGDKKVLLHAVAAYGFTAFLQEQVELPSDDDPVQSLRIGWDQHVGFGLAHPYLYSLMYGEPRSGVHPPAAVAADKILAGHIHRVAEAGRLRVAEDLAAQMVYAAGCGTTLTLLAAPPGKRDPAISEMARECVITAITTERPVSAGPGPVGAAVALRAALAEVSALSPAERTLLGEWLDRIAGSSRRP